MSEHATSTPSMAIAAAERDGCLPVLLVRHARTADNAARVLVGRRDVPLDEEGTRQAELLRSALAELAPTQLFSSPLQRARQTLDGLGPVTVDPRLVEVDHGQIEGLQELEFRRRFADFLVRWRRDPECTAIPDGESLGDAAARVVPALEVIAGQAEPPARVVICSHQLVIATLLCHCQGLPLARYPDFTCRNTAINVLGWDGGWRVLLTDWIGHLDS